MDATWLFSLLILVSQVSPQDTNFRIQTSTSYETQTIRVSQVSPQDPIFRIQTVTRYETQTIRVPQVSPQDTIVPTHTHVTPGDADSRVDGNVTGGRLPPILPNCIRIGFQFFCKSSYGAIMRTASLECISQGGRLATYVEKSNLDKTLSAFGPDNWVGVVDQGSSGWIWLQPGPRRPVLRTFWVTGAPVPDKGKCAVLSFYGGSDPLGANGLLNYPCDLPKHFICQYQLVPYEF